MKPHRSIHAAAFAVYFSLLAVTSGCDTLGLETGGESVFLTASNQELCFRFTGVTAGGSRSVLSVESIDIGAFLQQEGFSKSEVISATVESADIRMVFPLGESLSVLQEATVSLRASGGGESSVASASSFSDTRRTDLQTNSRNVGSIITAANFQGVLELVGDQSISDDFEITVNLDIRIEVEGV